MCHIQTWICFFLHLIFDGKKYDCEKGKRRFVDFIANKQTKNHSINLQTLNKYILRYCWLVGGGVLKMRADIFLSDRINKKI